MDARVDGVPVTPRAGKPVEVNALWINGLAGGRRAGASCSARTPVPRRPRTTGRTRRSARRFPTPAGWLYDVVDAPAPPYPMGGPARHDDDALRPNQLLAWSLPHAPLEPDPARCAAVARRAADPARAAQPRPGRAGLPRPAPGRAGRAGRRLPPGHRLAVADRPATLRRVRQGRSADNGELFHGIEAHLPEFGLGSVSETADGSRAARRHRLPVPGVVGRLSCCGSDE